MPRVSGSVMTKLFVGGRMDVVPYFGVAACVQISRLYRRTVDVSAFGSRLPDTTHSVLLASLCESIPIVDGLCSRS